MSVKCSKVCTLPFSQEREIRGARARDDPSVYTCGRFTCSVNESRGKRVARRLSQPALGSRLRCIPTELPSKCSRGHGAAPCEPLMCIPGPQLHHRPAARASSHPTLPHHPPRCPILRRSAGLMLRPQQQYPTLATAASTYQCHHQQHQHLPSRG